MINLIEFDLDGFLRYFVSCHFVKALEELFELSMKTFNALVILIIYTHL